jgi:hypothetical protein
VILIISNASLEKNEITYAELILFIDVENKSLFDECKANGFEIEFAFSGLRTRETAKMKGSLKHSTAESEHF